MKPLLLSLLIALFNHPAFAQDEPGFPLVSSSQLEKIHIKQATLHSYNSHSGDKPILVTQEEYTPDGDLLHYMSFRSGQSKTEIAYAYNKRKTKVTKIVRYRAYPGECRRDDTTTYQYKLVSAYKGKETKKPAPALPNFIDENTRFVYDETGRITDRLRSFIVGRDSTRYFYNADNKLVIRKHYNLNDQDSATLFAIETFEYDKEGQTTKELLMVELTIENGVVKHGSQTETTYSYNEHGLLTEWVINDWYFARNYPPSIKRYEYSYTYH